MTKFTKYQANYIKRNYSYLIGEELERGLKISRIWIVPIDKDFKLIAKKYIKEKVTTDYIADTYGKGQNLSVIAFSTEAIRKYGIFLKKDISEFIPKNDLENILKMKEK